MMVQSASGAAADSVTIPIATEANARHGLFCEVRGSSHEHHLRYDRTLAMAVQRQMLPRNPKQLTSARYAGASVAAGGVRAWNDTSTAPEGYFDAAVQIAEVRASL
jgi:hypothetical protein